MGNQSLGRATKRLMKHLDSGAASNPAYHDAAILIRHLQAEIGLLQAGLSRADGRSMTYKAGIEAVSAERDQLRAELERVRASLREVSAIVDGNIREIVRDLVNRDAGLNNGANPNDIYAECDRIDTEIDAAMGKGGRADGQ